MKTVKDIVAEYLTANGFDGLAGYECGCGLSDLFVCSNDPGGCTPGYKWTCGGCPIGESDDGCECRDGDVDGCIRAERQVKAHLNAVEQYHNLPSGVRRSAYADAAIAELETELAKCEHRKRGE